MRRAPLVLGAAAALLAGACARVTPVSRPTPDGAGRIYSVAELEFQAPADWRADGSPREVKLASPAGACLSRAEDSLARGAGTLDAVRRHASSFAGKKAVSQEADQGGWHGWAWAVCDRGEQYRVWFSGRTPVSRETIDVQRRLVATARMGGGS